jgi:type IV pilus assembly protein PilQ
MLRRFFVLSLLVCLTRAAWAQETPPVTTPKETISLDIKGLDIIDVLKMLATEANLNLVIDKNVSGRVVVFLKDVKPKDAFDMILASNNLVAIPEGNITRIMVGQDYEMLYGKKFYDQRQILRVPLKYARPQDFIPLLSQLKSSLGLVLADEATNSIVLFDIKDKNETMAKMIAEMDAPLKTEAFKLNYAKPEAVATALQDVLTKGIASIKTDTRSSQIIVTDYETKLEKIRSMITSLDERTREVQIDAKIVQVNLDDKTALGIDWEYILNKKVDIEANFGQMISTTGHKWTIGKTNPNDKNDYSVIIEALKTVGKTKILSSPRLTVTNNDSAQILVGSKQVYVTTTAVQGQTTTQTAESVNFVDVGVKLFVTPTIGHDGFISMKIRPEVSSVVQNYTTSAGNVIPIVETSQAETTILVQDGATLIIGGLMKDEKIKSVNKIPILGDIPLLGHLFRNSLDQTRQTELVIFLTCHIIDFSKKEVDKNI